MDSTNADTGFAWRRRISTIYGVATPYKNPNGEPAKPGWNHRLLGSKDGVDPEQVVDEIFDSVVRQLHTARKHS